MKTCISCLMTLSLLGGCLVDRGLYDERRAELAVEIHEGGSGVLLEGAPDCIQLDVSDIALGSTFTFEMYLRPEARPDRALYPVIAWPGFFVIFQDEDGYFVVAAPGQEDEGLTSPTSLMDGAYHHLAMVSRQNGMVTVYLDGIRLLTGAVALGDSPADDLYLGCMPAEGNFLGTIGEARLLSVALHADEFTPAWLPSEPTAATLALWSLNEGVGDEISDRLERAPGTLVGGTWVDFPMDGEQPR